MKSKPTILCAFLMMCLAGIAAAAGGPLNPNLATAEELQTVEGLTADMARTLVDGRPFADMTAVHTAIGGELTEEAQTALYTQLFLPLNLNRATREEILLVPGVGERMAHEFEEYRPYKSIEQFRREIGKYVDDDELARLERYVTLD